MAFRRFPDRYRPFTNGGAVVPSRPLARGSNAREVELQAELDRLYAERATLARAEAAERANLVRLQDRLDILSGEIDVLARRTRNPALRENAGPFAARNFLRALRGLVRFAIAAGMCERDPTLGIKLPRARSDGIHTWSEDNIELFRTRHAIGTLARLAFELALNTALRRGDLICIGRQHVRDGVVHMRTQKTGTTLAIPVYRDLQAVLDAVPAGQLTFLVHNKGAEPFTAPKLSEWFRRQCDAAGLPKQVARIWQKWLSRRDREACSIHGLRKAACRHLAEAGCSANEIAAISGHVTLTEVARYTKAADQQRLARNAMARRTAAEANELAPPSVTISKP